MPSRFGLRHLAPELGPNVVRFTPADPRGHAEPLAMPANPNEDHEMADLWRRVEENVHLYGWHVAMNYGDDVTAPSAYSIGAAHLGLPEVIVLGIDPGVGAQLVNAILEAGRSGKSLTEGMPYPNLANMPIYLKALSAERGRKHLPMADAFHCGKPYATMQMIYPDPDGRFPWDPDYHFPWQPLLYEP
jgi:hypothetical protein